MSANWRTLIQRSIDIILTKYQKPLEVFYRVIREQQHKDTNDLEPICDSEPYKINENLELRNIIITKIRQIVHLSLSSDLCIKVWISLKNRMSIMDEVYTKLYLLCCCIPQNKLLKYVEYGCKVIALQNVSVPRQLADKILVEEKWPWITRSLPKLLSQMDNAQDILSKLIIEYLDFHQSNNHPDLQYILEFAIIFNLPIVVRHVLEIAQPADKTIIVENTAPFLFKYISNDDRYQVFSHLWDQLSTEQKQIAMLSIPPDEIPAESLEELLDSLTTIELRENIYQAAQNGFDFVFHYLVHNDRYLINHILNLNAPDVSGTDLECFQFAVGKKHFKIAEMIFDLYTDEQKELAIRYALKVILFSPNLKKLEYLAERAKDKLKEIIINILNVEYASLDKVASKYLLHRSIPLLDVNEFVQQEEERRRSDENSHSQFKYMVSYFYQKLGKDILTISQCYFFRLAIFRRCFSGMEYLMSIANPDQKALFLKIMDINNEAWDILVEKVHKIMDAHNNARQKFAEAILALDKYIHIKHNPSLFSDSPMTYEDIVNYFKSAYIVDHTTFRQAVFDLSLNTCMFSQEFLTHFEKIILDVNPRLLSPIFEQYADQLKQELHCLK